LDNLEVHRSSFMLNAGDPIWFLFSKMYFRNKREKKTRQIFLKQNIVSS
jgi:hypothetical protein